MERFSRSIRGKVDSTYKTWRVEALDTQNIKLKAGVVDERIAFLTYGVGVSMLKEARNSADKTKAQISRSENVAMADYEIRNNSRSLCSPTELGSFFREVAKYELNLLLTISIIEDLSVAFSLPLEDEVRTELCGKYRSDPWNSELLTVFSNLSKLQELLVMDGASLSAQIDVLNKHALNPYNLRKAIEPKKEISKEKVGQVSEYVAKPSSQDLRMILEGREARQFSLNMAAIAAALEAHVEKIVDSAKTAKHLTKLAFGNQEVVEFVISSLEQDMKVDDLVELLREKRKKQLFGTSEGGGEANKEDSYGEYQRVVSLAEEQHKWEYQYTEEAFEGLRDGQIRLSVQSLLQKYRDTPELVEKRKIKATTDCWELRLIRENVRIYFFHAASDLVVVLLANPKARQKQDIARLQEIRDREALRIKHSL